MHISNIGSMARLLLGAAFAVASAAVQAADNYVLGMCKASLLNDFGAEIRPTYEGDIYLYEYQKDNPRYKGFTFDEDTAKVSLVKAPAHGKVEHVESRVSNYYYHYNSDKSYSGEDRFVMQVEKNDIKVRIEYLIKVPAEGESPEYLCSPEHWKISSISFETS